MSSMECHLVHQRKELVDGFKSQGFYEASNSTATEMTFYLAGIKPFEFGDMSWEVMYVSFANKHFYSIQFVKKFDTMEQAISEFNSIQSKLSSKYMMTEEPSSDQIVIKVWLEEQRTNNL